MKLTVYLHDWIPQMEQDQVVSPQANRYISYNNHRECDTVKFKRNEHCLLIASIIWYVMDGNLMLIESPSKHVQYAVQSKHTTYPLYC